MAELTLTAAQQQAVTTLGCSLMVASAAGSGKTHVLAERCAFLVGEAPDELRCNITELVVLTFTEAAAAEMRRRIRGSIVRRGQRGPGVNREHARRQLLLLDDAHISTIHAFCLWLIRQHALRLEVDPQATVLDADSAMLRLQDAVGAALRARQAEARHAASLHDLRMLYFRGQDDLLAAQVLQLYEFWRSLHDGSAWLQRAKAACTLDPRDLQNGERHALQLELRAQQQATAATLALIDGPAGVPEYQRLMRAHAAWLDDLQARCQRQPWDDVVAHIAAYKPAALPRVSAQLAGSTPQLLERVKSRYQDIRRSLSNRMQRRFGLFDTAAWLDGLARIEPHVSTLTALLADVDTHYTRGKRQAHVLDFGDLEQLACRLLRDDDGAPTAVARELHARFAHVLVDEFQDVNPLQEIILRMVSRESDARRANNLFCVGDVKQSIYRFRRAEPALTLARLQRAAGPEAGIAAVHLTRNFRAAGSLIDGINATFERLMAPGLAGAVYDEHARLQAGNDTVDEDRSGIEVHLIEQASSAEDDGAPQDDMFADHEDIERQARFMAGRVQALVREDGRALDDIVILLRAASRRAEQLAAVLQRMGVPTSADSSTGFFQSREVEDMLALLEILDNARQDIPLAAVLRSGVVGVRFDERELLDLRRAAPAAPFHVCLERWATADLQAGLRTKVRHFRQRLWRFRRRLASTVLPEALRAIIRETGFAARMAARPDGARRRANLAALLTRAEGFARAEPSAGLHGFLHFLQELRRHDHDLGVADPAAQAAGCVRIMTVHNSKGLEFDVVFLANLEKPFNLTDSRRTLLYERDGGMALKVVDPQAAVRYPSLLSARVSHNQRHAELAEELRILYVAMTRARQRLIMVGSIDPGRWPAEARPWSDHDGALPETVLLAARSAVDWLLPVWDAEPRRFAVSLHRGSDLPAPPGYAADLPTTVQAAARLEPLPAEATSVVDHPSVEAVCRHLDAYTACGDRSTWPAVTTVTALARGPLHAAAAGPPPPAGDSRLARQRPRFLRADGALTPSEIGSAMHVFLQYLDYARPADLQDQLAEMVEAGRLAPAQSRAIDLPAVGWFLDTGLGRRATAAASDLRREVPFLAQCPAAGPQARGAAAEPDDFIVLRGMIDLIVPVPGGFEVLDFKTDTLPDGRAAPRLQVYREQVLQYAMALRRMWNCRVSGAAAVLLGARRIEPVAVPES